MKSQSIPQLYFDNTDDLLDIYYKDDFYGFSDFS